MVNPSANRYFVLLFISIFLLWGCKKTTDDDLETRLLAWEAPQHPFLAANGRSNTHNDAYMTDTYSISGPATDSLTITTLELNRICITITFDSEGRIMTLGTGVDGKRAIYLINPGSLEIIDSYELPAATDLGISGAGYFYVDNQDRMVVPASNQHIYKFAVTNSKFGLQADYDLSAISDPSHIASVLPDWDGNLWFITEEGLAGIVNGSSSFNTIPLTHTEGEIEIREEIANSFAIDETGGVFVVTDYALYRLEADENNNPEIIWREEYDRGSWIKPGQFSQGSGTTPTLISDDFVAITDNAEPRMNVLVYKRSRETAGERLLCKVPVFRDNASATENSLIAWHNSIVVENNYGYTRPVDFIGKWSEPGMTRIDFHADGLFEVVWESDVVVPSLVSKYSSGSNIIYTYTKETDGWYFTRINANTGVAEHQNKSGDDQIRYNNHYSAISVGPTGAIYIGLAGSIIRFTEL